MALDVTGDYAVVDGTETVTLFRRQRTGGFDAGLSVTSCLRRVATRLEIEQLGQVAMVGMVWHLWATNTGSPPPKIGDVIEDADDVRWTVSAVDYAVLSSRYRLVCVMER